MHLLISQKTKDSKMQQKRPESKQESPKKVNIATMVRVRPLLESEADYKESVFCRNEKTLEINLSGQRRNHNLETLFNTESTQRQVFESVEPIINRCSSGYNVTIFTYGQTGSGKTHTMFGSDWNNIIRNSYETVNGNRSEKKAPSQSTFLRSIEQDENHSGLIPRSIHHLFGSIITKRKKYIKVYCSFLQLYNETMLDLFEDDAKSAKEKKMFIHENSTDGIYIEGLNEMVVETADECLELMKKGERNRIVRQTSMNIKSSRSHTIFQLLIEEVFPAKKTYRRMKLNLCDLAGSEKINKAEKMQNDHFEELKNINLSLTTLGKVISSLSDKVKPPYRESKLTRLLQDSLGGNTYTAIIATVTTKASCLDETINTLKFLERAKQIRTELVSRQINDNPEMKNLEKEIAYLKDILKMKRNGTHIVDVDLNEKLKRLQQENQKLKDLVDQSLVERLTRENSHLKMRLERKENDELSSQGFVSSGLFPKGQFQQSRSTFNNVPKEHKTIEDPSIAEMHSHIDVESKSDYKANSVVNTSLKKKAYETNNNLNARSTDKTSKIGAKSTKTSIFPDVAGRRSTSSSSANKILDRIQQIERVKQTNKLKLEKELESMNKAPTLVTLSSKDTFARSSKYSNKYRY